MTEQIILEWIEEACAAYCIPRPFAIVEALQAARATPADHSSYALQMLVAAGHIPQAKVDEALAIATKIPGVGEAQSVRDAWISVDERLPEHEAIVLATGWRNNEVGGERYTTIACFHQEGSFYEQDTGDDLYPPTHWMLLPDDPK